MPWKKSDDRNIVCQECGAVCKRFGWIERTLSSIVSRRNVCCVCSGEDPYCSNCKKLLNRSDARERRSFDRHRLPRLLEQPFMSLYSI